MSVASVPSPTRRTAIVITAAVVVVGVAVLAYVLLRPAGLSPELAAVHDATSDFQEVAAVEEAGYGELVDVAGIACIEHDDLGAMGIHYVHGDLVGDATVEADRPEAIIYEPTSSGLLELVGVEYVVFQEGWDAANDATPQLFGQTFTAVGADNRYGIPAFYELHAWVWKDNPAGEFADYNPDVTCEHASAGSAGHAGNAADAPAEPEPAPVTPRERLGGW